MEQNQVQPQLEQPVGAGGQPEIPTAIATPPPKKRLNKKLVIVGILVFVLMLAGSVSGWFILKNKKSEASPALVAQPIASPDLYEGWGVYENKTIGFKIKYPQDYQVLSENELNVFLSKNIDNDSGILLSVGFIVFNEKNNFSYYYCSTNTDCVNNYLESNNSFFGQSQYEIDEVNDDIQIIQGIFADTSESTEKIVSYIYPFSYYGKMFSVSGYFRNVNDDQISSNKLLIKQIVSSLEFTPQDVTEKWIRYENSTLGFSVKIPDESVAHHTNQTTDLFLTKEWQYTAILRRMNLQVYRYNNLNPITNKPFGTIEEYSPRSSEYLNITIDGFVAKDRGITSNSATREILLLQDNYIWKIFGVGLDKNEELLFDQILASFEFVETGEMECSLSLCDCKCYPKGETREEKEGVICGINCLGIYGVYGCEAVNGECKEIVSQ